MSDDENIPALYVQKIKTCRIDLKDMLPVLNGCLIKEDNSFLIYGSWYFFIYDSNTFQILQEKIFDKYGNNLKYISIIDNTRFLVAFQHNYEYYELKNGKYESKKNIKLEKDEKTKDLSAITILKDQTKVACGEGNLICIRELETGKLIKTLAKHEGSLQNLFIHGKYLISSCSYLNLCFWDLDNYKFLEKLDVDIMSPTSYLILKDTLDDLMITGGYSFINKVDLDVLSIEGKISEGLTLIQGLVQLNNIYVLVAAQDEMTGQHNFYLLDIDDMQLQLMFENIHNNFCDACIRIGKKHFISVCRNLTFKAWKIKDKAIDFLDSLNKFKVNFIFNGNIKIIESTLDEFMGDIFERYIEKIGKNIDEVYFLYNGDLLSSEKILSQIIGEKKEIQIIVIENEVDENSLKTSKDIICPLCKEKCFINFKDYQINFSGCKNNHHCSNILIKGFKDFQKIDESKILCSKCKKNKSEITKNIFFRCLKCNIDLCPLCKVEHGKKVDKKHIIINYNDKNYLCNEHGERIILHCNKCIKDICDLCDYAQHKFSEHNCTFLYKMKIKKSDSMNNLKIKIDSLKNDISNNKSKAVIENLELYYDITNNIINSYNKNCINYYIFDNINNILEYNEKIIKDIDTIIKEKNIEKKDYYISKIYEKTIINNIFNIKYKLRKAGKLTIFGKPFVKNNKNNFVLIINENEYKLTSILKIIDIKNEKKLDKKLDEEMPSESGDIEKKEGEDGEEGEEEEEQEEEKEEEGKNDEITIKMEIKKILEIKLKQVNNINDISYMFAGCKKLVSIDNLNLNTENVTDMSGIFNECEIITSLPDISGWNTSNVIKMNNMFSFCEKLIEIPDISKWDTTNVIDISNLFNRCKSLETLTDISKWNTENITNLESVFNYCSNLKSLPDISKWNVKNVTNISKMFRFCKSLESLPDISKWNLDKITEINKMFQGCISLSAIPDISNWNISNISNLKYMFNYCESITSLPDISKWNTSNINDMSYLFYSCKNLLNMPDISKWDTKNVTNMRGLFCCCESLTSLPDISNWNTENLENISYLFNYCSSLKSIPDISEWNTNKFTNISDLFGYCKQLTSIPDISKWNIKNVYDISCLFDHCLSLKEIPDISKWNTSKVNNMCCLFQFCESLITLPDISIWDTRYVEKLIGIFSNCKSLKSLPEIGKWDTGLVEFMFDLFENCSSLDSQPDISRWDKSNVDFDNREKLLGVIYKMLKMQYSFFMDEKDIKDMIKDYNYDYDKIQYRFKEILNEL